MSEHQFSARRREMKPMRRITIVGPEELEEQLCEKLIALGASGYTSIPCYGVGRTPPPKGGSRDRSQFRLESIVTRDCSEAVLEYLRREVETRHRVTTCIDDVDVLRPDHF
jgi:hypothetical protein